MAQSAKSINLTQECADEARLEKSRASGAQRAARVGNLRQRSSRHAVSVQQPDAATTDHVNPSGSATAVPTHLAMDCASGLPDSTPVTRGKGTPGNDERTTAEARPPPGPCTEDGHRPSGLACAVSQPPAITTFSADNAFSSPNTLAFAPYTKVDHLLSSMSTVPESNLSPTRKGIVRFGGATLREFIPLTTLTEKLTRSPTFYGSLGFVAVLISVTVAVVILSSSPKQRHWNQCDNEECHDAHDYLHSFLDASVDPCDDFYRHVCHRWHIDNVDGATLAERAARDLASALHSSLLRMAAVPGDAVGTSRTEALLVRFYSACSSFVMTSTHSDVAKRLVRAYRGDADVLQLTDTAAAVRHVVRLSLQRGISTLFKVRVVWHGGIALYVSRGKTLAEKLSDHVPSSALVEFFREALEEVSAVREAGIQKSDVNATLFELLKYDQRTAQSEANLTTAETVTASQFGMLVYQTDPRLWLEYVNSMLPRNLGISEASPVMCHELTLVKAAVESLATNHRIGLIYIFFHILTEIGRLYYRSKFLYDKPGETDVVCFTASLDVMGSSWLDVYANLTRLLLSAPSRAGSVFSWVRNVSSTHLLDSGMDEADKRGARTALEHVTLLVHSSRPLSAFNDSARSHNDTAGFAAYYASLEALEATRRLQDPPSLEDVLVEETVFAGVTTYTRLLNAVVLPLAMRRPPLMYSTKVPLEFDMGTTGVVLAKALFEAGLPSARNVETWYELNVKQFVDCVQRSSSFASVLGAVNLTFRQGVELFAWARAVRIAHSVMRNSYYLKNGAGEGSEEVWAVAQRTFFQRFCLLTCSAVNAGQEARLRCLVPLLNMAEFASAFQCRGTEVMRARPCLLLMQ
ncbi:hypothetical protein HPB49_001981 [Dermacentor silvarum]|uniref:Uncharacterized protein n=1 Tax=Dermacentor silvarum TaxID=543639 RepID=A0ACB8D286_DERSI|nr:hypothetical protein HPB49_001981 [Dermacentor silvarum]